MWGLVVTESVFALPRPGQLDGSLVVWEYAAASLVAASFLPRIGGEVRTEALVLSRGGRSLLLIKVAQNRVKLRKRDVKNAFLQGQGTGQDVELVAESVTELADNLYLSKKNKRWC